MTSDARHAAALSRYPALTRLQAAVLAALWGDGEAPDQRARTLEQIWDALDAMLGGDVSADSLRSAIKRLRKHGFHILTHRAMGYQLMQAPRPPQFPHPWIEKDRT